MIRLEFENVNTNKLHDELIVAGIVPELVESKDGITWVTVDDSEVNTVNEVAAAHDPIIAIKNSKIEELDLDCTADIESGFMSTAGGAVSPEVLWGMDLKTDQPNLSQQAADIALGLATEPIYWKPKGIAVPVPLTIEQFKALWEDGKTTKRAKIARCWDLKQSVMLATTEAAIADIHW